MNFRSSQLQVQKYNCTPKSVSASYSLL